MVEFEIIGLLLLLGILIFAVVHFTRIQLETNRWRNEESKRDSDWKASPDYIPPPPAPPSYSDPGTHMRL